MGHSLGGSDLMVSVWFVALARKHPERPPLVDAGLPGAWVPQVWRGGSVGSAGSRGAELLAPRAPARRWCSDHPAWRFVPLAYEGRGHFRIGKSRKYGSRSRKMAVTRSFSVDWE